MKSPENGSYQVSIAKELGFNNSIVKYLLENDQNPQQWFFMANCGQTPKTCGHFGKIVIRDQTKSILCHNCKLSPSNAVLCGQEALA